MDFIIDEAIAASEADWQKIRECIGDRLFFYDHTFYKRVLKHGEWQSQPGQAPTNVAPGQQQGGQAA